MPNSAAPSEPSTIPAPYAGAPPCHELFCGGIALPGSTRCARHSGVRLRNLTPRALCAVAAEMDEGNEG